MSKNEFREGDLVGSTQMDMETHMGIVVKSSVQNSVENAKPVHEVYWFFREHSLMIPVKETFLRKIE